MNYNQSYLPKYLVHNIMVFLFKNYWRLEHPYILLLYCLISTVGGGGLKNWKIIGLDHIIVKNTPPETQVLSIPYFNGKYSYDQTFIFP